MQSFGYLLVCVGLLAGGWAVFNLMRIFRSAARRSVLMDPQLTKVMRQVARTERQLPAWIEEKKSQLLAAALAHPAIREDLRDNIVQELKAVGGTDLVEQVLADPDVADMWDRARSR